MSISCRHWQLSTAQPECLTCDTHPLHHPQSETLFCAHWGEKINTKLFLLLFLRLWVASRAIRLLALGVDTRAFPTRLVSFFKAPRRCQASGGGAHVQLLPFLKTICFGHGMCVQRFTHIRWDTPTSLCCGLDWMESLGSPECWGCYDIMGVEVSWTG